MKTKRTNEAPIKTEGGPTLATREVDSGLSRPAARAATGGRSDEVCGMLLRQTESILTGNERTSKTIDRAIKTIGEVGPSNATEGMLAVQMIAVHMAAIEFIRRGRSRSEPAESIDENIARASRLMRLFTQQLEAMAKLKGTTGQQKMTVEHVHVHSGGQAIVGQVGGGKGNPEGGGVK
jgi:hypothetical protein